MDTNFSSQLVLAFLTTKIIEMIKRTSKVPWVTEQTDALNKWLGAFLAALSAAGIAVATTFDPSTGTFTLMVSGLTISGVVGFLWQWLSQWALQQAAYEGISKRPSPKV